jgi:predicted acyltransferase
VSEKAIQRAEQDNQAASTGEKSGGRVMAVDVLRGFDMFWLVGGAGLAIAVGRLCGGKIGETIIGQLEHKEWEGFTFYDLIFPLFVFVVGMSVVFSLGKLLETKGRWAAYKRILRRFVLMYAMGLIYYGGFENVWPHMRLLGVLQRLALCYLFTGFLFCHLKVKGLAAVFVALLVGYCALLTFVPVPGAEEPSFEVDKNWATYIDKQYLPGHKHNGDWDPEGLLSTFPAVGTCLLGVFASLLLREKSVSDKAKVGWLIGGGALLVVLGFVWGIQFPVIKKIWTSSYVLVAGGYSFMLLGILYLILDVWKIRWWAAPFVWIGVNPLTIYMARRIVDFNAFGDRFVGGSIAGLFSENVAFLLHTSVSLALSLLLVWFLYKKKVFLRV